MEAVSNNDSSNGDAAVLASDQPLGEGNQQVLAIPDNIEELAAKARLERQANCDKAMQKVLDDHNCSVATFIQFGNSLIPTHEWLKHPVVIASSANVQPKEPSAGK